MKSLFKKKEGMLGEAIACEYLRKQGYQIIGRNFRIRNGEIDIIAIEDSKITEEKTLVFIEVKTRRSSEFGTPLEAISYWKIKNLVKTAEYYKVTHPHLPEHMRIDAVGIILKEDDSVVSIELVKNLL